MILAWDTGASFGLTPFKADFVDYMECEITVKDVTKVNKIIGVETPIHKFKSTKGENVYLPHMSYHLPMDGIHLLNTKPYHHMYRVNSIIYSERVEINLSRHELVIQMDRKG